MDAKEIFERLWTDYTLKNPEARRVYEAFIEYGEKVENDHIAFRTFYHPHINIDVLARPFLLAGYVQKGFYTFEDKHLTAKHYEHSNWKEAPRVFISQLMTDHFSFELQEVVNKCITHIPENMIFGNELVFAGNVWGPLSFQTYEMLRKESEYAAWLYIYGFCANHFTVSVNHLQKLNSLEAVNQFLIDKGFILNESGGRIKGTPSELLEQSSTKAGIQSVGFTEGNFDIPSCYYEFARRYPDADGELYNGFIAKSADKIFESTDFYEK